MYTLILLLFTDFLQPINSGFVRYTVSTGDRFMDSGGDKPYINCSSPIDNQQSCTSTSILCGNGVVSLVFTEFGLFPSSGMVGGDNISIYSGPRLLYSSSSGVSALGKTFRSDDNTGCLVIVFTATSAYNMQGWSADIIVSSGVPNGEDPPTSVPPKAECNLVCKGSVEIDIESNISLSPLDFIMNPGFCDELDYTLTFVYPVGTNIHNPASVIDMSHIGKKFEYKVMTTYKGISNYCWGYINVR